MATRGKSKKGLVRMVSIVLVVLMVLSLAISSMSTALASSAANMRSGITNVPKLTREEITKALRDTEFTTPTSPWSTAPSYNGYRSGVLNKTVGQKATDRLNALRVLAGLTQVTYKEDMALGAQSGALLMSTAGIIVDTPAKPADMTEPRYNELLPYAQSCVYATTSSLCEAVDTWMAGTNDATLSARRQQLNPSMPWVGYGYVKNPSTSWWLYKDFCAAAMTSGSSAKPEYNFISWPASGYFPTDLFTKDTMWSISLNSKVYAEPDANRIQVILTRVLDGTSWILYNGRGDCYISGNTIMFRPDGIDRYSGIYTVSVSGINKKSGESTSIVYRTEFFDMKDFEQSKDDPEANPSVDPIQDNSSLPPRDPNRDPTIPTTRPEGVKPTPKPYSFVSSLDPVPFTDVKEGHWARKDIDTAARCGAVVGTGNGKFEPDNPVTGYEFATILLRYLYRDTFDLMKDTNPWTIKVDRAGTNCGIWDGLANMDRSQPITRNQMAVMISNAINGTRLPRVKATSYPGIASRFVDWDEIPAGYRDDVMICIYNGILGGIGDSCFGGNSNMDRAQAATVFCRLYNLANRM